MKTRPSPKPIYYACANICYEDLDTFGDSSDREMERSVLNIARKG